MKMDEITGTTGNTQVKKDGTSYVVAPMTNLDFGKVLFYQAGFIHLGK